MNPTSRRRFIRQSALAAASFYIVPRFVLGKGYTAPSDMFGLGFIGSGKQARGLMNQFKKQPVRIIAAAEVDATKLNLFKSLAEKAYAEASDKTPTGGFKGYPDYRQLLADPSIDGVVIATPDHWHAYQAVKAAEAKKHIYLEKPLTRTLAEGRAVVNAVKKNKVVLQTGSMQRSWKNFRSACELVRNGYIGKIKEVLVNVGDPAIPCNLGEEVKPPHLDWEGWIGPATYHPFHSELSPPVEKDIFPMWRKYREYAGGILSDWGAHMFDIAQWGLGMDESGPVQFNPPKDPAAVRGLEMIYANGVVLKHVDFGRGFGVRFVGEKGTIDISREYFDSNPANIATATIQPGETKLYVSDDHYADWLNACRKGSQPICPAETGHRSNSVCALANIAYELRRPLKFDPVKETFKGDKEANKLLLPRFREGWKI
ncbi:MAG TPA: Gfo/Idh/MocA family oxidoreductase [Chitinophagaceae bacterium]|nr:Gfo/Idh/MocA family oxidoreductase [Chitinophagaceae bacterium]